MSNFTPLSSQKEKIMNSDWVGYIKIDPPLSQDETKFLRDYLNTLHFHYSDDEYSGLYFCHNDKEVSKLEIIDEKTGKQAMFYRSRQKHVPSLSSPLVLGFVGDSQSVNAIGLRAYSKGINKTDLWFSFLIQHFFAKDAIAKTLFPEFSFLQHHILNGELCYSVPFVSENRPRFFNCSISNNKVYSYVLALPVPILSESFKIAKEKELEKKINNVYSSKKRNIKVYNEYYLNPFKEGTIKIPVYYAPGFDDRKALKYKMEATIKSVLSKGQKFKRFTNPDETKFQIDEYLNSKYEEAFMKTEIVIKKEYNKKNKVVKF